MPFPVELVVRACLRQPAVRLKNGHGIAIKSRTLFSWLAVIGTYAGREQRVGKLMSKSELIEKLVETSGGNVSKRDVKGVMEALAALGHKELKRTGAFLVPGLAKFVVIKKAATKARKGINPFTKEPTIFKAKPARKIIKARPVKAAKDALL
jgi:DNA-binding protein HU-beta